MLSDAGVRLCLEPLSTEETDFLTSCAETVRLMDRLAHPNVWLHLDVKAMASEAEAAPVLIRRHADRIGHFHANDANRRGPGFGDTDFRPIFAALRGVQSGRLLPVRMQHGVRPERGVPKGILTAGSRGLLSGYSVVCSHGWG